MLAGLLAIVLAVVKKEIKFVTPVVKSSLKKGRFFYCPFCHYSTDRDYIGALNIYRMYQEQCNKRFSIRFAKLLSYMGIGIPCDRPPGSSVQVLLNR